MRLRCHAKAPILQELLQASGGLELVSGRSIKGMGVVNSRSHAATRDAFAVAGAARDKLRRLREQAQMLVIGKEGAERGKVERREKVEGLIGEVEKFTEHATRSPRAVGSLT